MRTSKGLVPVLEYIVRYSTELRARGTHAPRFEIFAPRCSITNLASPTIIITFVARLIVPSNSFFRCFPFLLSKHNQGFKTLFLLS
jgi:hypothetical protein